MEKIGLFLLNAVVFPNSMYPLHIFENRYKQLINECYNEHIEFGINLMLANKVCETGVTATIRDIFKTYSDGKMDIGIEGKKRYKLNSFSEGEKPYSIGQIEYLEDDSEEFDYELMLECVELFNEIAAKITKLKIEKIIAGNLDVSCPSYTIAQKSGLSLEQKQKLIEINSENERMDYMLKHLKKIMPTVTQAEFIKQIIKNDGYIKPIKK